MSAKEEEDAQREDSSPGQPHPQISLPAQLYGAARRNSSGPDLAHEPTLRQLALDMQAHMLALDVKPLTAHALLATGTGEQTHTLRNPADHSDVLGTVQVRSYLERKEAAWWQEVRLTAGAQFTLLHLVGAGDGIRPFLVDADVDFPQEAAPVGAGATWDGKTWAQMSPIEKHRLFNPC